MDPRLSALSALSAPAETTRLFMRIPQLSDRTALYRTVRASHDSLSRFLSWCTPDYAPSDTEQWLQGAAQEALTGKGFHYLLFERVSGDLVGVVDSAIQTQVGPGIWATGCASSQRVEATQARPSTRYWIVPSIRGSSEKPKSGCYWLTTRVNG